MPLKYVFHFPQAVRAIGSLHGALFVIYVLAVLGIAFGQKWRPARTFLALTVSVIPFGPFLFDKRLQREAGVQRHGSAQ